MYEKICDKCGYRLTEFYRTGMLGCPNCYNAFEREVYITLKKIQGKTFHTGKSPKITADEKQLIAKYQELSKMKERAVIDGRFDDASNIGKEIQKLLDQLKRKGLK